VAVDSRRNLDGWSVEESLEELASLVATAGAKVVGRLTQRLPSPLKTSFLGKGKLEELIRLKESTNYTVAVFDDELSPLQQRNLEEALQVKVIDRVALILDIFSKKARTREGQLQVELAQYQYLLPRLAGQWSHLERLGGGIGTRGPGETQLETDKRLIQRRIGRLEDQIDDVRKHRQLYWEQRRRNAIPVVALVGYTNAGKSSLMNTLTRAGVLVENRLFTTLDPTTRRLSLSGGKVVLMSDTVGFIRKLPTTIISAFKATLEELAEASILVHVVDITTINAYAQCQTVERTLKDLGILEKPRITALNKIDLLQNTQASDENSIMTYLSVQYGPVQGNTVFVSANKHWGMKPLLEKISTILVDDKIDYR
jgi:GTP-binding protein HflX